MIDWLLKSETCEYLSSDTRKPPSLYAEFLIRHLVDKRLSRRRGRSAGPRQDFVGRA